jgi:hypothetical protein
MAFVLSSVSTVCLAVFSYTNNARAGTGVFVIISPIVPLNIYCFV